MAEHNPITKITSQGESFNIGALFDHIYLSDENDFSLKDFFTHYSNFMNSNMFMLYSSTEPQANNVLVWYDTQQVNL